MEIHVIRHTHVAIGKDTCYGQIDVPLADTFTDEANNIKQKLPTDFDAVYHSPLSRCTFLANELGFETNISDAALMEVNFGEWEGMKWNDINEDELNVWMKDFVLQKPPNGENLAEMFARVSVFFNNLRSQQHNKVLIITHAGVIRCIWAYLLEIPLNNIFKIPVDYNEIFSFKLSQKANFDAIKRKK